jgi:hypothetical protein
MYVILESPVSDVCCQIRLIIDQDKDLPFDSDQLSNEVYNQLECCYTYTLNFIFPRPGTYDVFVVAIGFQGEIVDQKLYTISVRFPDLEILNLSTDKSSYISGEPVVISATLANEGYDSVETVYTFYLDGELILEREISLSSFESTTRTYTWMSTPDK